MIIFLIFVMLYSILDAWHDYAFVNRKTIKLFNFNYQYWHSIDVVIKALVISAVGWFSVNPLIGSVHDIIYIAFIYASIRWTVHDLTYNFFAGHKWHHIGSGAIDKTLMHWQFFLKIIALFFASFFIVQYFSF